MLLFKNLLLFLFEITGNQDCKHLVSAWLGESSPAGDSAGVEEGVGRGEETEEDQQRTRVNSDWRMPASLAHGICFRPRERGTS